MQSAREVFRARPGGIPRQNMSREEMMRAATTMDLASAAKKMKRESTSMPTIQRARMVGRQNEDDNDYSKLENMLENAQRYDPRNPNRKPFVLSQKHFLPKEASMPQQGQTIDTGRHVITMEGNGIKDVLEAAKSKASDLGMAAAAKAGELYGKAKDYGNSAVDSTKEFLKNSKEKLKKIRDEFPDRLPKWMRAGKFGLHDSKTRAAPENETEMVEMHTPEGRMREEAADEAIDEALEDIRSRRKPPKNKEMLQIYHELNERLPRPRPNAGAKQLGYYLKASELKNLGDSVLKSQLADQFNQAQLMRYHHPDSFSPHMRFEMYGLHDAQTGSGQKHRPLLYPGQRGSGPRMHAADNALRNHILRQNGIEVDDIEDLHEGKATLFPGHGEAWYTMVPAHSQFENKMYHPNLANWL